MLDTSLTWDIAKEQCGEGTERLHVIPSNDDAVLFALLADAARAQFPDQGLRDTLIPCICNSGYSPYDYDIKKSNTLATAFILRLHRFSLRKCLTSPGEALLNALLIQGKQSKDTIVRHFVGGQGAAFAVENDPPGPSIEDVKDKGHRGNRGRGWPYMLNQEAERVGIEQRDEVYRVICVSTQADLQKLFLRHSTVLPHHPSLPEKHSRRVVNGAQVWSEVSSSIRNDSFPAICHANPDVPLDKRESYFHYLEQYREDAWNRIRKLGVIQD